MLPVCTRRSPFGVASDRCRDPYILIIHFLVLNFKNESHLVDIIFRNRDLSYYCLRMILFVFIDMKIENKISDKTGQAKEIVAAGFALATLVLAENVTVL